MCVYIDLWGIHGLLEYLMKPAFYTFTSDTLAATHNISTLPPAFIFQDELSTEPVVNYLTVC